MKIALACDHGGYDLKMAIIAHLEKKRDRSNGSWN